MKTPLHTFFGAAIAVPGTAASCVTMDDDLSLPGSSSSSQQKINFDVLVTRDGKVVTKSGQGVTKTKSGGGYDEGDWETHIYENNDDF